MNVARYGRAAEALAEAPRNRGLRALRLPAGAHATFDLLTTGVGFCVRDAAPVRETKTAERKDATGLDLSGGAWLSEHHRTEKICGLDVGGADRG